MFWRLFHLSLVGLVSDGKCEIMSQLVGNYARNEIVQSFGSQLDKLRRSGVLSDELQINNDISGNDLRGRYEHTHTHTHTLTATPLNTTVNTHF